MTTKIEVLDGAIAGLIQGRVSDSRSHDITQAGAPRNGVLSKCVACLAAHVHCHAMALREQIVAMFTKAVYRHRNLAGRFFASSAEPST